MWGNVWEWLATSDWNGMMKIKGGAFDEERSQCRTEERGNARAPLQGYHNVGFRISLLQGECGREMMWSCGDAVANRLAAIGYKLEDALTRV